MNATVWDVLQQAAKENGKLSFTNPSGGYITAVTYNGVTLAEIDNGNNSGWMYTLNGAHPDLSVDQQYLEEGDVIVFHYTDDYTKEDWNLGSDSLRSDKDDRRATCRRRSGSVLCGGSS